jgi:hypothetical protein
MHPLIVADNPAVQAKPARHTCANVDWLVAGIITIEVDAGVNFHC